MRALPSGHVPSGWTKSGTTGLNVTGYQNVWLIRNDATYGYQQRTDNSTWVRINKSYWISQEFTLPRASVVSLSFKVAATASTGGSKNSTDCTVQFDGMDVMTFAAQNWTTETKTGLYFPLGAFSLTTNSTLFLRSDTVVNGFNEKAVDLGGWELFVDASVGAKQLLWSKDIVNGTLRFGPCDYQMDTRLVIYGRDARVPP